MRALLIGPLTGADSLSNETRRTAAELLAGCGPIALIPYGERAATRTHLAEQVEAAIGRPVTRVDTAPDAIAAVLAAEAIVVAGGNTWCLAHHLRESGLVAPIRMRVAEGVPFLAWGAGAVMASPSLMTTSDLPECLPPGLDGLHLVPFHVASLPVACPEPLDHHCPSCQTTEDRIAQLSLRHDRRWIVGLGPGAAVLVDGGEVDVVGGDTLPLYRGGRANWCLRPGIDGRFLLDEPGGRHTSHRHSTTPCQR